MGTNGGLALFNPMTETFTCFRHDNKNEHSLVGDNIHCITETKDENLWIASDLGGISLLDLHNFSTQNVENLEFKNITHLNSSLSSPNTRMIQEDKFGNVWIGNYSSGLDFISHNQSNFHIIPYFYEIGETKNPETNLWSKSQSGWHCMVGRRK